MGDGVDSARAEQEKVTVDRTQGQNPFIIDAREDPNVNGGNGKQPWRLKQDEKIVAPIAKTPPGRPGDPPPGDGNGQAPWMRPPVVAPIVEPGKQPQPGQPGAPIVDGGNGQAPWLRPPGADPVVVNPPDRWKPPTLPDGRPVPADYYEPPVRVSGGGAPVGDGTWRDYVRANGQGLLPAGFRPAFAATVNPLDTADPVTDEQRKWIEDSGKRRFSNSGFVYLAGATGATVRGGIYSMDAWLLSTSPESRTGIVKWWEKYSPAQTVLAEQSKGYADAVQTAANAESRLQALADDLGRVRGSLTTAVGTAEATLLQHQQMDFLQKLKGGALTDPRQIKDMAGKLFAPTEQAHARLMTYADDLIAGKAVGPVEGLVDDIVRQGGLKHLPEAELKLLRAQLDFLRAGKAADPKLLKSVIGTADELVSNGGTKLFQAGAQQTDDLLLYAERSLLHAEGQATARLAASQAEARLAALELKQGMGAAGVHGGPLSYVGRGFGKAVLVSGGVLAGGYVIDSYLGKAFGYQPTNDGLTRLGIDAIGVGGILASPMPGRYKIPLAAAAFTSARIGDWWYAGGGGSDTRSLLRPTMIDAVGVGGFAVAPVPMKYKLLGMAGTVALGRGWNLFAQATGLQGEQAIDVRNDVRSLRDTDMTSMTEGSFTRTADRAKGLGIENEALLELELSDFLATRNALHPVRYNRGVAALSFGLGQARLEAGSRLDPTQHGPDSRFLKGTNYDLGGDATCELRRAAGSLFATEQYIEGHKGEEVNGQKMDDAYLEQVRNLRKKVEAKLDLIYGEHDMNAVYNQVKDRCHTNIQEITGFIVRYQELLGTLRTTDKRYVAKINRDLALANLAYADYIIGRGNGEEGYRFLAAAASHMQAAEGLEKDSKDLEKLKIQGEQVKRKLPGALQSQWNSSFNNPFQIRPEGK